MKEMCKLVEISRSKYILHPPLRKKNVSLCEKFFKFDKKIKFHFHKN